MSLCYFALVGRRIIHTFLNNTIGAFEKKIDIHSYDVIYTVTIIPVTIRYTQLRYVTPS